MSERTIQVIAKDHSTLIDQLWRYEREGYKQVGDIYRIPNFPLDTHWGVLVEKIKEESTR